MLFLIGSLDNEFTLLGALIDSLIFVFCGAALAKGSRLSATWLVKVTIVAAILSFAAEQSLKAAPYRLLLAFVLIKGALALRAS